LHICDLYKPSSPAYSGPDTMQNMLYWRNVSTVRISVNKLFHRLITVCTVL